MKPVNLADLYQFDEIYWVPQDRPQMNPIEQDSIVQNPIAQDFLGDRKTKIQSLEQKNSISQEDHLGLGKSNSTQVMNLPAIDVPKVAAIKPTTQVEEQSFVSVSVPTLDQAALPGFTSIKTPWVIVGKLLDTERSRLNLIVASSPLLLAPQDWSIYIPGENEPSLTEFIQNCVAHKFVFLGQQPAVWQSDFQVTELVRMDGKLVYFFPRLISTLTEAEKSLKLVFWNALKSMI